MHVSNGNSPKKCIHCYGRIAEDEPRVWKNSGENAKLFRKSGHADHQGPLCVPCALAIKNEEFTYTEEPEVVETPTEPEIFNPSAREGVTLYALPPTWAQQYTEDEDEAKTAAVQYYLGSLSIERRGVITIDSLALLLADAEMRKSFLADIRKATRITKAK